MQALEPRELLTGVNGLTTGDDTIVVAFGTDHYEATVNGGQTQLVPFTDGTLTINGLDGNDALTITGTSAAELATLYPTSGNFHDKPSTPTYTVSWTHVESTTVNGAEGDDDVLLHESAGNDTFSCNPFDSSGSAIDATLTGPGYSLTANRFQYAVAYGGEDAGEDEAYLSGSSAGDYFQSNQNWGRMEYAGGTRPYVRALGFGEIHATGGGGNDSAALLGVSTSNDTVTLDTDGYGSIARTVGPVLSVTLDDGASFETITVSGGGGGSDVATFYDSADDDAFTTSVSGTGTAAVVNATLTNSNVTATANGFKEVRAYSQSGGADVAYLYGSDETDSFYAYPDTYLEGSRLQGPDTDSDPNTTTPSYLQRTYHFPTVHGYGTVGGGDIAYLYDSAENDTFTADSTSATMQNASQSFLNIASDFRYAHGLAYYGGVDSATLTGSDGADTFQLFLDTYSRFIRRGQDGTSYYDRTVAFETVTLDGAGGTDTLTVTGTSADETAILRPSSGTSAFITPAAGNSPQYVTHWTGIETATLNAGGGEDVVDFYDSSGNDTLTTSVTGTGTAAVVNATLLTATDTATANGFKGVYAHSTSGGLDVANLYGSGQGDTLTDGWYSGKHWVNLSNASAAIVQEASSFGSVKAVASGVTNSLAVDPIAKFYVDEDAADTVFDMEGDLTGLTFSISQNTNPALFTSTSVVDTTVGLDYAEDEYGKAVLVICGTGTDTTTFTQCDVTVRSVADAPVLAAIADQQVDEYDVVRFTATATDRDSAASSLSYYLKDLPQGMSKATIDPETGAFRWTPGEYCGGNSYEFTVRVVDETGASDSQTVVISVGEVNHAPVLTTIDDLTVSNAAGRSVSFAVLGFDPEGATNPLTFAMSGAPASVTLNPATGIFTYTAGANEPTGQYSVTISATDGGGAVRYRTFTLDVEAQSEPVWIGLPSTICADASRVDSFDGVRHYAKFYPGSIGDPTDPLAPIQIEFDWPHSANSTVELVNPPAGASITSAGHFTWTLTKDDGPKTYDIVARAVGSGQPGYEDYATIHISCAAPFRVPPFGYGWPGQATISLDDHYSTPIDTPVSMNLTANDHPLVNPADSTRTWMAAIGTPSHGDLVYDDSFGQYVYQPDPGFVGVDSFTYQIDNSFHQPGYTPIDGASTHAIGNVATVTIKVGNPGVVDLVVAGDIDDDVVMPLNKDFDEGAEVHDVPIPDNVYYGIVSGDEELRAATITLTNPLATDVSGEWWITLPSTGLSRLRVYKDGEEILPGQRFAVNLAPGETEIPVVLEGIGVGAAPLTAHFTAVDGSNLSGSDAASLTVAALDLVFQGLDEWDEEHVGGILGVGGQCAATLRLPALSGASGWWKLEFPEEDLNIWRVGSGSPSLIHSGTHYADVLNDGLITFLVEGVRATSNPCYVVASALTGTSLSNLLTDRAKVAVVEVDIDTDSDNTGAVDGSQAEDLIEDNDVQNLGKRIFINWDDDNRNGHVDSGDILDSDYCVAGAGYYADDDFAAIRLNCAGFDPEDLAGYELWLSHPYTLAVYASVNKQPVVPGAPNRYDAGARDYDIPKVEYTADGGTRYKWVLGPGIDLPEVLYVEGRGQGTYDVTWRLVRSSTEETEDIVARDTVNIKVEQMVYPFATQTYADWNQRPTSDWVGLEVAQAWHMDKALVDYILSPGDKGHLETIHPNMDDPIEPGTQFTWSSGVGDNADGPDCTSTESYANGFTMEFDYSFETTRGDGVTGYVQIDNNGARPQKLSFVGNSGVKFGGKEVAILDVKSMVAKGGGKAGLAAFDPLQGGYVQANGDINTNNVYATEPLKRLMSGVRYGGEYTCMRDYQDANTENLPPEQVFFNTLVNNCNRTNGHMKISWNASTYMLEVYMDGETEASYSEFLVLSVAALDLQSHWGSGVIFSNMDVIPWNPA